MIRPNPLDFTTPKRVERFWNKVDKREDGCWLWLGAKTPGGYGTIAWGLDGVRKAFKVHRVSYALAHFAPDHNTFVTQTCGNKLCVNPDHMELSKRGSKVVGTSAKNAAKTHCERGGHLLAGDNLVAYDLLQGRRRCKACSKEASADYKQRKTDT